ncbi:MAG: S-layer homology domain-containing protein [Candidatus Riflebacteria bacterium]|nr:S-layer homology domain-containing protein [Candidatus Riflebacteria bacterium]
MRQTKNNSVFSLLGGLLVTLLCLVLPATAIAQSAAFQDLPRDHWAYSDVEFLISQGYMEGYPDGTFKGRKVTTRYDVALILARILKRMEEKKATIDAVSEEERAALSRLTKEFRDELGLLDVRVDSLERRMVDSENKMKTFEDRLPKVQITGFYRGRGQYIIDPETVGRDDWGDEATFTNPGLVTFYQQLYLRFTGKPLGEKIETFYELYGYVKGRTWNQVVYNEAGSSVPNPFDKIDNYVRYVQNDNYVRSNKLHFVSKAKSMKVRVFSGESISGIDNPMNILTEDTDVVYPYQGVEVSGSESGVSYQGSVLKSDIRDTYSDTSEMISGRMVWKLPEKFSEDSFSVGTSYAEKILDYKTVGNSNTVRGVDVNYSTERAGKIQATAEFLTSAAYLLDTSDKQKRNLGDEGSRFDLSIQEGGLTGTVKHYDYGKDFRAMMAPIWAYDIGDVDDYPNNLTMKDADGNYGRPDFAGEKLTRFGVNYDFGNKLLAIANNLSVEATYLSKTWEADPKEPQPTDGYSGRKFTFQLLSDFTDSTTLKYDFIQKWDAYEGEQGWRSNAVELNLKLSDSVSSKGKMYVLGDPDDIFEQDGQTHEYNERIGYFEVNSDINPRVYAKGSVEHQVRWVSSPKENTRVDYIGEATYNLTPTTSFTGGIQHVDYVDSYDSSKSSLTNAILAELKKNFTDKFRGRAFYSRGVLDYKDGNKDSLDRENIYGELIYNVSKDATITLKFGYDYPSEWRWAVSSHDNGRDHVDIHTQKMLIFEARSNF